MTREECEEIYEGLGVTISDRCETEADRLEVEAVREVFEQQCLGQGFDVAHWPYTRPYMKFDNRWPWYAPGDPGPHKVNPAEFPSGLSKRDVDAMPHDGRSLHEIYESDDMEKRDIDQSGS